MKKKECTIFAVLAALIVLSPAAYAQTGASGRGSPAWTQMQLELVRGSAYTTKRPLIFGTLDVTPHIAVWVESPAGTYRGTLYVSLKGGKQDFWVGDRPHPLPVWDKAKGIADVPDAMAGSSPAPAAPETLTWIRGIPSAWQRDLVLRAEVNLGFDFNASWPDDGKAIWGQPSLLWEAPVGAGAKPGDWISLEQLGQSKGFSGSWVKDFYGLDSARNILSAIRVKLLP